MGTLIWKSLNVCFQTDSKRVREGIKAGDAFLSLGQVPHVLESGVRAVQGPRRGNRTLHPRGARRCFCVQGVFVDGKDF